MNYAKHTGYFFILLIFLCFKGFGQLSKTHYIPPLTNSPFGNANPEDQYIYISTPSTFDVPYTIIPVGQPTSSYITGNVSNTNAQEIFIGNGNGQLFMSSDQTSLVTNNKGYIIEAEGPVYVSVRMNAGNGAQAGALVSKGLSALGKLFRVGTFTNENPQTNYLNFLSVMATEDNTVVNFSDLPAGLIIDNYTGSTPISVTLNKTESYTIATNSSFSVANRDGLIGCLVSSDKPVVVNCGSANGSFHNGGGRDYGIDQIVGLDKVGKEYIFVRGDGLNQWENILIVAHTDNTSVSVNGSGPIITINAGEYYVIEGDQYNNGGNLYVETSQDVFAYQGVGATDNEANQGMFFVPPLSCEARGNLDNIAQIESIGSTTYSGGVTIVTKTGATVTINNTPISNFSTIGPSSVNGKSDYVTYKVTGLFGNISVQSTDELYCAYFNFNGVATSGSFYSGFPSAPEINFAAQFATLGNCIPNITLEAANTQNFDNYEWWFDDGTGPRLISSNIPSITPSDPGKYKLIGEITCTLERLESIEVPVSICPDDIDNDGIIDNIDIDNDNDGILNCTESKGDVTINIQNINAPQLIFEDGSINTTITSSSYTFSNASNTFTADVSGNFASTVLAGANEQNDYTLNFTEAVNVKYEEDTSVTDVIIDGAYYIARIAPVDKNITLIDPDDRLIVDSNFDGVFETGITQISGSEIHFKLNPSPNGNTPYQFFANQVDSFSFIHHLSNISNNSSIQGIISLTCFKRDNDNDGVKDELDLDSDNDGIPDFIENLGVLILPSGVDDNLNGLDDAYDPAVLPVDTDNDGVPDYLDLDSDNDGIYDLIESEQSGIFSDSGLDGIEDGPDYGSNGWTDVAETAPDSGVMGYTLSDSDTDGSFNYSDLDSDGDGCSDVIEAGFSDANNDDLLGDSVATVDLNGLVNNASDGYTIPNPDYLISAPILISEQPLNTEVCESSATTLLVNAPEADVFQWEWSTDGVNWSALVNGVNYNGTQSDVLEILNVPQSFDNYQYRVKLDRSGNTCGIYSETALLTVHPLPIVNTPGTYSQCDDVSNDGQAYFNLTLDWIKEDIDPNYLSNNLSFTYYLTQSEAENGSNPIPDPTAHQDALGFMPETVWIRAEDPESCYRVVPLTLVVNPYSGALSTYNPPSIFECDDGLDPRDGVATFDMTAFRDHISNVIFSTIDVSVHLYENQIDAETELNEITAIANHQNTNSPNIQNIWVRIKSDLGNDCLGLEEFPNLLVVEALPIANPVTIDRVCDDGSDGTPINNGFYNFDTASIESSILGTQDPADITITYWDDNGNPLKDGNGNDVVSPIVNPLFISSQTITIRATNNITQDPDGPCYDETTLEFIIDEQPLANAVLPQVVCDGDAGDIDNDGTYAFDTSAFESTIRGTQTGMDIFYDFIDENGMQITNSTELPNPLISGNQSITVQVINPVNPNCSASTSIDLIVHPLPDFTINEEEIVCTSDPSFTVLLSPLQSNMNETFQYEWYFEDGTFLGGSENLEVSTPGNYFITLTHPVTLCSRTKMVSVQASELANITQNDLTIVDISENNSVTINNPNGLGAGNYQFALESKDNEISFPYQDSPVFNYVRAGVYTLFVRDAICGVVELDVYVVGYRKFFTPNGDSRNDYWQIQGLSALQANSDIYIFDRFGKLIKQLPPFSQGWDGTFNGALLPTDDYWFKVSLADGRTFMGHFTLKR